MDTISLHESSKKEDLYPLTLTRSIADIRVGIFTIREKWEKILGQKVVVGENDGKEGQLILSTSLIPCFHSKDTLADIRNGKDIFSVDDVKSLHHPWEIFEYNDWAIRRDFEWIKKFRSPATISPGNRMINADDIFVEPDAKMEYCILNAEQGPIYIGRGAVIMEGSTIRGPAAICENSIVKMGTTIYGATTIGPSCIAGGEIKNSVMLGFSNKGHHGYLGDSVIGEWCNLGAGTSISNVKNSGGHIKVWNEYRQKFEIAGTKCGLLMGDFSRSAINTSFNTGTVVGVCANIFNPGELTEKYIGNFSWGGKTRKYKFEIAIKEIGAWMKMKNKSLTDEHVQVLKHIFDQS